jgi:hypothetical protein
LPAVAAELAEWAFVGLDGWRRVGRDAAASCAPSPDIAKTPAALPLPAPQPAPEGAPLLTPAPGPSVDATGLRLAPGGWPWVLRAGTWCWLHDVNRQQYSSMILKSDVRLQIKRTHGHLITLKYRGAQDKVQELTDKEFEDLYEHRVSELKATYLARTSAWDPSACRLTLAALRWAPLSPKEHTDVDEWLRALGGHRYPRLAQWLASCVELGRPAPALYIHGELQTGKTLLARGIARLWQTEPAPFSEALSDFNEAAATCPLMYADEGFPDGMSFNVFREMVTSPTRRVNEKYKPKYPIEGCVRIILSTNNEQALRYQKTGALTAQDMQAISDRLLVIWAGSAARDVLAKHHAASFVDDNKLAEHVLWLASCTELAAKNVRMCAQPEGADEILDAIQMARYELVLRIVSRGKASDGVHRQQAGLWVHVPTLLDAVNQSAARSHQQPFKVQDLRDFCSAFAAGPRVKHGEGRQWM